MTIKRISTSFVSLASFYSFVSSSKRPPYGGLLIPEVLLLSDGVLECLAGLERRDLHRGDGDLLRRVARVHTHARCTLGNAERSEAGDREGVAALELLRDRTGDGLEGTACGTLRDACGVRDRRDQILLGHVIGEKGSKNKRLAHSLRMNTASASQKESVSLRAGRKCMISAGISQKN